MCERFCFVFWEVVWDLGLGFVRRFWVARGWG